MEIFRPVLGKLYFLLCRINLARNQTDVLILLKMFVRVPLADVKLVGRASYLNDTE